MTSKERAAARLRLMLEAGQARLSKSDDSAKLSGMLDNQHGASADRMAQLREKSLAAKRARVATRQEKMVHVDTIPNRPPVNSGQAALNDILIAEHKVAMIAFPSYRKFIELRTQTAAERLELGLRYQTRRFLIGSKRRHISIWSAVRKWEKDHAGPVVSPGGGQMYSSAIHSISLNR